MIKLITTYLLKSLKTVQLNIRKIFKKNDTVHHTKGNVKDIAMEWSVCLNTIFVSSRCSHIDVYWDDKTTRNSFDRNFNWTGPYHV